MKKLLFRKLLSDCVFFFLITLLSASVIIWVFQAVNFLDIMVEDGRDYIVYINYSLLSLPKILSRILPFAIFFSFFYVLSKYEMNNELMILWNFGINKVELINFFLKISLIIVVIQIIFTTLIVPKAQNFSRTIITSSNVDFFEGFIKPQKFVDNIKGLTIFAEEKDKYGKLKNIYLKKETGSGSFQITYAKSGYFKTNGDAKFLVLQDGETINGVKNKFSKFNFRQSELNLSQLDSNVIKVNKIQETSTRDIIKCLNRFFNKDLSKKKNPLAGNFIQNCTKINLDNIFKEIYKRFITPLYIPLLVLSALILIIYSKENTNYSRLKIIIFLIGFSIIVFSEITEKFVVDSFYSNLKILVLPFILLLILYIFIFYLLNKGTSTHS